MLAIYLKRKMHAGTLLSQIWCSKHTHSLLQGKLEQNLDLITSSEEPREKAVGLCRPLPILLSIIQ